MKFLLSLNLKQMVLTVLSSRCVQGAAGLRIFLSALLLMGISSFHSIGQTCQDFAICIQKPDPDEPKFNVVLEMPAGGLTGITQMAIFVAASSPGMLTSVEQVMDVPGVSESIGQSLSQASLIISITPSGGFNLSGSSQVLFKVEFDGPIENCISLSVAAFTTIEFGLNNYCSPIAPSCLDYANEHCFEGIEISGRIETVPDLDCDDSINHGLPGATVSIIGSGHGAVYNQSFITTENGDYRFTVGPGYFYSIVPSKTLPINCGVTTVDYSILTDHVLSVNYLDTHQELVAADLSQNNFVSTGDLHVMRAIILGVPPPNGPYPSWDFIAYPDWSAFHAAPSPQGTSDIPDFANQIGAVFNQDAIQQDFIAVKMGDINNTCTDCGLDELSTSNRTLAIRLEDVALQKGEERIIPVRIADIENATVIAMGLLIDQHALTILEVIPGELDNSGYEDFNLNGLQHGELRYLWSALDPSGVTDEQEVIFSLRLRANDDLASIAPFIQLNDALLENRAYKGTQDPYFLTLAPENFKGMHKATPNPFGAAGATLHFHLPVNDTVDISLYDASGRLVEQHRAVLGSGLRQWQIGANVTLQQGVYFYSIKGSAAHYSGKLLKL